MKRTPKIMYSQRLAIAALKLECRVSDLVNQAYGLTPEEIALMKPPPPACPFHHRKLRLNYAPSPRTVMSGTLTVSRNRDAEVYRQARTFLDQLHVPGLTPEIVESYLEAPAKDRPLTIPDLYQRLLESAQNANMKSGVIGGSIGGVRLLGPLLGGFAPEVVLANYGTDSERLLKDIVARLKPRGQIRQTSRSLWPQYCRTVLSAAGFLAQFKTVNDFYTWVDFFDSDPRARPGLPLILSEEVAGIGFALACDFLKELGYANFGKPDVHVRDIFKAAGLCAADADDYCLFKAICRVAESVDQLPYTVDKVFWLIGSGYFYNHKHIGREGRIPHPKKEFIRTLNAAT